MATGNNFDYSKPFSEQNLEAILQSGDSRTSLGKFVQNMASVLSPYGSGSEWAWHIYDLDERNAGINVIQSGFNQLLEYAGKEKIDVGNLPNGAEIFARMWEDYGRKPDGSTVQVPNSVNLLFDVTNEDLGSNVIQEIGRYMGTDEVLHAVSNNITDLPPPVDQENTIFNKVKDFIFNPVTDLAVTTQRLVGGKANQILLNKIGYGAGLGPVGTYTDLLSNAFLPNDDQAWTKYLERNGYIDSQGNVLNNFKSNMLPDALNDFLGINQGVAKTVEQQAADGIRAGLIQGGVKESTLNNITPESLYEVANYAKDNGVDFTQYGVSDDILKQGYYESIDPNRLYNFGKGDDGTYSVTEAEINAITPEQINQLKNNLATKNPYDWFSDIDGIDVENYGALIEAATPVLQSELEQAYGDWANSGWEGTWDNNDYLGYNKDLFFNYEEHQNLNMYHAPTQTTTIRDVFSRAGYNQIAVETGIMHPDGDKMHGIDFRVNDIGNDNSAPYKLWWRGNDEIYNDDNNRGVIDPDGDGIDGVIANVDNIVNWYSNEVADPNEGQGPSLNTISSSSSSRSTNRYSNVRDLYKVGQDSLRDYQVTNFTELDNAYDSARQNLRNKFESGEITSAEAANAMQDLNATRDEMKDELLEEFRYPDDDELEDLQKHYGTDFAERHTRQDINGDGEIDGLKTVDFMRRERYIGDMADYGDANNNGIPDYPTDAEGNVLYNEDEGRYYDELNYTDEYTGEQINNQQVYDEDAFGGARMPGYDSQTREEYENSWEKIFPGRPRYFGPDTDGNGIPNSFDTDGDGIPDTFTGEGNNDYDQYNFRNDYENNDALWVIGEDGTTYDLKSGIVQDDPFETYSGFGSADDYGVQVMNPSTGEYESFNTYSTGNQDVIQNTSGNKLRVIAENYPDSYSYSNGVLTDKSNNQKFGIDSSGDVGAFSETGLHPTEQTMVNEYGWIDNGDGTISKTATSDPKVNMDENTAGQGKIVGYHSEDGTGPYKDTDGDGVIDTEDADPDDPDNDINIGADTDNDGTPDYQDDYPNNEDVNDSDNDGTPDAFDAFPEDSLESVDSDGDGIGDNLDDFPNDSDEWEDLDFDGLGDNDDDPYTNDKDNDGVIDSEDAFMNDPNESADEDGDGIGDNSDQFLNDYDNDGISDDVDLDKADPEERTNISIDDDNDGIPDYLDLYPDDGDNDGSPDNEDLYPDNSDEWEDTDGDGLGDNKEDLYPNDRDNDGYSDDEDAFPDNANEWEDDDGDGLGDNEEDPSTFDRDNDGVIDDLDCFPDDPNESEDTDGDGIGDVEDGEFGQ